MDQAGDWTGGSDPADEWVLDPVTGEYRMRLPEERLPALPVPAPEPEPARRAVERTPARLELPPAPRSRAASRGNDRRSRRGGRRRNSGTGGGGLWLAGTLGVVGLVGCGTGGYLLFHDGGNRTAACSAAKPSAPAPGASQPPDATAGPSLTPGPKAQPIDVRVTVLNGSGVFGQAESALNWMQNTEDFVRTSNGGPAKVTTTTTLVYAPDHADQARTLAAAMHLPPSALHGTGTATGLRDPMVLTLGKDFKTPGQPLVPIPTPSPSHSVPAECGG